MNKYYLYIFCALSLSGFMHQPTYSHSNACRKVLVKHVFCYGLRGHNPEYSDTSFYTVSVKESACHLQQHKKLLVMHIAWTKFLVLNFSKFQMIFSWPFLCFIPEKIKIPFLGWSVSQRLPQLDCLLLCSRIADHLAHMDPRILPLARSPGSLQNKNSHFPSQV